ncbi:hypothetical protein [Prochlorococcus sp. MIT 1307]|uniref:hypothetical protein n=1 Tax=Prochlorococcus sp. MIT 1307 TaxID=3096219 RepID=UPI002A74CC9B|nr:hypothetical protein [Prochlorococcus sp. MIT 1307]
MKAILSTWIQTILAIFSSIFFFSFAVLPPLAFAKQPDLSPAVSEVVQNFTDHYCLAIADGIAAETAVEVASKQIIRSLIFSGLLKEVMSVPKEEMATFVTTKTFEGCGEDIGISEQELNDYLVKLANGDSAQSEPEPFKPFGIG